LGSIIAIFTSSGSEQPDYWSTFVTSGFLFATPSHL
jgi:hypothetical protein